MHNEQGEGQFSVPCYKRARNREQLSKLRVEVTNCSGAQQLVVILKDPQLLE